MSTEHLSQQTIDHGKDDNKGYTILPERDSLSQEIDQRLEEKKVGVVSKVRQALNTSSKLGVIGLSAGAVSAISNEMWLWMNPTIAKVIQDGALSSYEKFKFIEPSLYHDHPLASSIIFAGLASTAGYLLIKEKIL